MQDLNKFIGCKFFFNAYQLSYFKIKVFKKCNRDALTQIIVRINYVHMDVNNVRVSTLVNFVNLDFFYLTINVCPVQILLKH